MVKINKITNLNVMKNKSKDNFEPGINIKGKVTILSEGCRGHLGKEVIKKFKLDDKNQSPQQGTLIANIGKPTNILTNVDFEFSIGSKCVF